jgi:HlyD family secretion protein
MLIIPDRESALARWLAPAAWGAGLVLVVAVAGFLLSALVRGSDGAIQPVILEIDQGDVVETVSTYGTLQPSRFAVVLAEVEGVVEQIHAYPGMAVSAGDAIVSLVNRSLERERDRLETGILEAQANLRAAQARLNLDVLTARNEVRIAESEKALATRKLAMLEELLARQSVSRVDYLEARLALERAELTTERRRENLQSIQLATEAELESHQLRLEVARAQFAAAQSDLQELVIRALRDGLVTSLNADIHVGAFVGRGLSIGQIADPDSLAGEMYVSASNAPRLVPGQPVELRVQSQPFTGTVERIDPSVVDGQVRVLVDLGDVVSELFRPNVEVSGRIIVARADDVLRVPRPTHAALSGRELPVMLQHPDGQLRRVLRLGIQGDHHLQISEPTELQVGQQLVIEVAE